MARARGPTLIGALEQAAAVRRGDVSPAELVDAAIARIEATNPELNFLVTECFEQARAATGSTLQCVQFPSPGWGRDIYACTFTTLARVFVA